jgi:hypothetical protein
LYLTIFTSSRPEVHPERQVAVSGAPEVPAKKVRNSMELDKHCLVDGGWALFSYIFWEQR